MAERIIAGEFREASFIEAHTKFDEWHNPHIDMTFESIKSISNNEIYPDELTKLLSIIEIFNIAFKLTIEDAKNTINELNGELERELNLQITN